MWLEVEDGAGNDTVTALGSITTAAQGPMLFPPAPLTGETTELEYTAYGDGVYNVTSSRHVPFKAFDGNLDSNWIIGQGTHFITIELPSSITLSFVRLINWDRLINDEVIEVVIKGRNAGDSWTTLYDNTIAPVCVLPYPNNTTALWKRDYPVNTTVAYNQYRLEANVLQTTYVRGIHLWGNTPPAPTNPQVLEYPPVALTGTQTTVTGQSHGNGVYNVTWPGYPNNYNCGGEPWRAFNNDYRFEDQNGGKITESTWMGYMSSNEKQTVIIELPTAIALDSVSVINGKSSIDIDINFNFRSLIPKRIQVRAQDGTLPWDSIPVLYETPTDEIPRTVAYIEGHWEGWKVDFLVNATTEYTRYSISVLDTEVTVGSSVTFSKFFVGKLELRGIPST
jgi:hypothetical protein